MYKVEMYEAFGPFCGKGGFASCKAVAQSKSPNEAFAKAKAEISKQPQGGGVPILSGWRLTDPYGKTVKRGDFVDSIFDN